MTANVMSANAVTGAAAAHAHCALGEAPAAPSRKHCPDHCPLCQLSGVGDFMFGAPPVLVETLFRRAIQQTAIFPATIVPRQLTSQTYRARAPPFTA